MTTVKAYQQTNKNKQTKSITNKKYKKIEKTKIIYIYIYIYIHIYICI